MSHEAEQYIKERTAPRYGTRKKKRLQLDSLVPSVTFKRATYDVMDNKSAVSLTVERSRSNGKITVNYETEDGTAMSGVWGQGTNVPLSSNAVLVCARMCVCARSPRLLLCMRGLWRGAIFFTGARSELYWHPRLHHVCPR